MLSLLLDNIIFYSLQGIKTDDVRFLGDDSETVTSPVPPPPPPKPKKPAPPKQKRPPKKATPKAPKPRKPVSNEKPLFTLHIRWSNNSYSENQ